MPKITFIQHNGTEQTVDALPGQTVMEAARVYSTRSPFWSTTTSG